MADPLPGALAALAGELQRRGFSIASDEASGVLFREVVFTHPDRTAGSTVRLIKDRGLWTAEIDIGDRSHDSWFLLLALNREPYSRRAQSHAERLDVTLAAVDRLATATDADLAELEERLDEFGREYRRQLGTETADGGRA